MRERCAQRRRRRLGAQRRRRAGHSRRAPARPWRAWPSAWRECDWAWCRSSRPQSAPRRRWPCAQSWPCTPASRDRYCGLRRRAACRHWAWPPAAAWWPRAWPRWRSAPWPGPVEQLTPMALAPHSVSSAAACAGEEPSRQLLSSSTVTITSTGRSRSHSRAPPQAPRAPRSARAWSQ